MFVNCKTSKMTVCPSRFGWLWIDDLWYDLSSQQLHQHFKYAGNWAYYQAGYGGCRSRLSNSPSDRLLSNWTESSASCHDYLVGTNDANIATVPCIVHVATLGIQWWIELKHWWIELEHWWKCGANGRVSIGRDQVGIGIRSYSGNWRWYRYKERW